MAYFVYSYANIAWYITKVETLFVNLKFSECLNTEPVRYLDKSLPIGLQRCIGPNLLNTERTGLDCYILYTYINGLG